MKSFVIYQMATGLITKQVQCAENMLPLHIKDDETYLEGVVNSGDVYVRVDLKRPKLDQRPVLPVQELGKQLRKVPKGAILTIEGTQYEANGEPIHLEFDYPGSYTVEIRCWPYLNWSTQIEN